MECASLTNKKFLAERQGQSVKSDLYIRGKGEDKYRDHS
jgi:hypothetical protein